MPYSNKYAYEESERWALKDHDPIDDGVYFLYTFLTLGIVLMIIAYICIIFGIGTSSTEDAEIDDVKQLTIETTLDSSNDDDTDASTETHEVELEQPKTKTSNKKSTASSVKQKETSSTDNKKPSTTSKTKKK